MQEIFEIYKHLIKFLLYKENLISWDQIDFLEMLSKFKIQVDS